MKDRGTPWSDADHATLARCAADGMTVAQTCEVLDRPDKAVRNKAYELEVKFTRGFTAAHARGFYVPPKFATEAQERADLMERDGRHVMAVLKANIFGFGSTPVKHFHRAALERLAG